MRGLCARGDNNPRVEGRALCLACREKDATRRALNRTSRDAELYNLLPGEREKVRAYQKGLDPISGMPLVPEANLDHDHHTGLVRGLLNPMTNRYLVDNEKKLIAMLLYIQHPPAPQALGETVYGILGQAKHKKKMRYGPDGSPMPQLRKAHAEEKKTA
jgi:Recombination endonuclease VII